MRVMSEHVNSVKEKEANVEPRPDWAILQAETAWGI